MSVREIIGQLSEAIDDLVLENEVLKQECKEQKEYIKELETKLGIEEIDDETRENIKMAKRFGMNWIATDPKGRVFASEQKPTVTASASDWMFLGCGRFCSLGTTTTPKDFTKTLISILGN